MCTIIDPATVQYIPATRPCARGFRPMICIRADGRMRGSKIGWKAFEHKAIALYWASLIAVGASKRLARASERKDPASRGDGVFSFT